MGELHAAEELNTLLSRATIPHAPIGAIEEVMDLPFVRDVLLHTETPAGERIRLPPAAVDTPWLKARGGALPFAPGYAEHTEALLTEAGLSDAEIQSCREEGIIA